VSAQDVEVVRQAVEAFNSGDVARILALTHPEFEGQVAPELSAEPDTYRGRAGIERYFESFREAFDRIRFDAEEIYDAGDSVVVAMRMSAIGKQTQIPVEQRNGGVWSVRDGKITRIDTYASAREAREAAGLEE
jgi:ketosteroid isomerase-like protein